MSRRSFASFASFASFCALVAACAEPPPRTPTPRVTPSAPLAALPPAAPDTLGPKPESPPPPPYVPEAPRVRTLKSGLTLWVLERHTVPLVSMTLVVPGGSAADPRDKHGLAALTANMLDEGAGRRGALDLARHFESLGADVSTGAATDYSFAQLTVLKRNLRAALPAYVDVLAKPTLRAADFTRTRELWRNELKARRAEPEEVAHAAGLALHYGLDHPYGHPPEGTLRGAAAITLRDVAAAYARSFRADAATLVIVGDVTDAEIREQLEPELGRFPRGMGTLPSPPAIPPVAAAPGRRVVVVDRPDAPQSVVSLLLPSVPAAHDEAPLLSRANIALGGSFTSRLNQDLREERGLTYGASSRFSFTRGAGVFTAHAAVQTDKTQEAVQALLADVATYAHDGPTAAESEKTRLVARADLVQAFEGVSAAAARLARLAGVGLPADHDARSAGRRDAATRAELGAVSRLWFDPAKGAVLVVGPRATVVQALEPLKLGPVEALTLE